VVGLDCGTWVLRTCNFCVRDKKLGKMWSTIDGPWRPPPSYGRYGSTHPATKHTTINYHHMTGLHFKTRKKYLLLVILLLMHVASTSTSNDDAATATRRWAPCSPLDDIANSDAVGMLPTIYSTRAGRGGGGGGGCGWVMLLRLKKRWGHWGCNGRTFFFVWWLVRQWKIMVIIWY
jgi:hypothetical protein